MSHVCPEHVSTHRVDTLQQIATMIAQFKKHSRSTVLSKTWTWKPVQYVTTLATVVSFVPPWVTLVTSIFVWCIKLHPLISAIILKHVWLLPLTAWALVKLRRCSRPRPCFLLFHDISLFYCWIQKINYLLFIIVNKICWTKITSKVRNDISKRFKYISILY